MTLLTPDEARKQACPFFRHCVNESEVLQRGAGPLYYHDACRGPDCKIGWRWAGWRVDLIPGFSSVIEPNPPEAQRKGDRLGFCGAFGKPEDA
jgi:hypothetical protein